MNLKMLVFRYGMLLLVAAIIVALFMCSGCSQKPDAQAEAAQAKAAAATVEAVATAKEKKEETQRLVQEAQSRIDTCSVYVNRNRPSRQSPLAKAKVALEKFAADPDKDPMWVVDREIDRAYALARRPTVVAELHQVLAEQRDYLSRLADVDSDVSRSCWKHLEQAEQFLRQYSSGGHDGLAIAIRQESAYVQQRMEKREVIAPTRLISTLDLLLSIEKIGSEPKPNLRLHAHTKQARRFYDAFVKSGAGKPNLLSLASAECMYALKLNDDPAYVLPPAARGKADFIRASEYELVEPFLQVVDSFVRKIEIVQESFPNSEAAVESLTKVRKTFDFVVARQVEGHSDVDSYWVKDALRNVDGVIEKLREEAGPRKLDVPLEANFQVWLDQYRKDNESSWVKDQSCEFWLVPQAHIGTARIAKLIAGREHCCLNTTFKGMAVLAVTKGK